MINEGERLPISKNNPLNLLQARCVFMEMVEFHGHVGHALGKRGPRSVDFERTWNYFRADL